MGGHLWWAFALSGSASLYAPSVVHYNVLFTLDKQTHPFVTGRAFGHQQASEDSPLNNKLNIRFCWQCHQTTFILSYYEEATVIWPYMSYARQETAKSIMLGMVNGDRHRGRPPRRWMDNIVDGVIVHCRKWCGWRQTEKSGEGSSLASTARKGHEVRNKRTLRTTAKTRFTNKFNHVFWAIFSAPS